jgi:hypothetical protein
MSPDFHSEIEQLRARVTRLERAQQSPRNGRTTLSGAARYLGMCEETLRQRHARGEGPHRVRLGRHWSYAYTDLDKYAEDSAA